VVVASQVFATGTTAWLAFALGVAMVVGATIPALFGERRIVGLALDGVGALLGVWTIIASLVFSNQTVKWLSFSEALGFVALAIGGLILNQVRLTRRSTAATPVPAVIPQSDEVARHSAIAA